MRIIASRLRWFGSALNATPTYTSSDVDSRNSTCRLLILGGARGPLGFAYLVAVRLDEHSDGRPLVLGGHAVLLN